MHLKLLILCLSISGLEAVSLLMSWTTSVRIFEEADPRNMTDLTPLSTLATAIDYHYGRGEVYFSDGRGRIYRGWMKQKEPPLNPVFIAQVGSSDGLAVDWVNDNLYWTDVSLQTVETSDLDGLFRRTLFNSTQGVDKPRAIVLDPFKGLLFWSDWGKRARVESSGLDGKQVATVVSSGLVWPNGLALDLDNKKLFILDAFLGTVTSCDYDGSNPRVIRTSRDLFYEAFAVTFYSGKLYWASWLSHALFSMDITTGNTREIFKTTRLLRSLLERMNGLKALHPSLQRASSPCLEPSNPCPNAGCSHKCLTGRNLTTTCVCPFGFSLGADNKTCVEEGYVVASFTRYIRRYNLKGNGQEALIDDTKDAIAIDYHFKKNLIFWSDILDHRIYSAPLGQLHNKTMVVAAVKDCEGLAVDWVHDVLYWTDTEKKTLEASRLDGSKRIVLFSSGLDQPRDIVLDPFSGFLFWTDWGSSGSTSRIEQAVLDGTNRKTLINNGLAEPTGMAIDTDKKIIYWVNSKSATVSSSKYDGSKINKILRNLQTISKQPFAMSVFQNTIYWTDRTNQTLYKAEKSKVVQITRVTHSSIMLWRPNGVKVVHSSLQMGRANPCRLLNCRSICLGSRAPQIAHCMPDRGYDYPEK